MRTYLKIVNFLFFSSLLSCFFLLTASLKILHKSRNPRGSGTSCRFCRFDVSDIVEYHFPDFLETELAAQSISAYHGIHRKSNRRFSLLGMIIYVICCNFNIIKHIENMYNVEKDRYFFAILLFKQQQQTELE